MKFTTSVPRLDFFRPTDLKKCSIGLQVLSRKASHAFLCPYENHALIERIFKIWAGEDLKFTASVPRLDFFRPTDLKKCSIGLQVLSRKASHAFLCPYENHALIERIFKIWAGEDLNLHGFLRWFLKPVRLPFRHLPVS